MSGRSQPEWKPLEGESELYLHNSLTKDEKFVKFVPQKANEIKWYSCGPTVYDASHMGHARSYISFDILRRVLSEYFGYKITYVMNITDIDDKIIKRARENYLFEEYIKKERSFEEVFTDVGKVFQKLTEAVKTTQDKDKLKMLNDLLTNVTAVVETLETNIKKGNELEITTNVEQLLTSIRDPLADYLDSKFGSSVTDNSIFSELPRYWEDQFHEDMRALNILEPDMLTRVSEYVPKIVKYIEKIIENGLAYESNGSVYFDVNEFDKRPNHFYAKLVPEAYGNTEFLQDGEGVLSDDGKEKRSSTDFALWKRSKAGEPWWDSPWGKGRPGWHIECSVMASDTLGSSLDIHTGGVDLKFPHHDNELAQAEAYYDNNDWVRYFLHSGHLHIDGHKMSKSLKNFTTIKDALKKYSSRQLRFAFLLHSWTGTLDYSDNMMKMALNYEKKFNKFFLNIKRTMKGWNEKIESTAFQELSESEIELNQKFSNTQKDVHKALCENVNTSKALKSLGDFITNFNNYMDTDGRNNINLILLKDVAIYITKMEKVFGLIASDDSREPVLTKSDSNVENILMPYLKILSEFRNGVCSEARALKASNILQLCDNLRDEILPNVGVRLENREGDCATIELLDKITALTGKEERKLTQQAEKDALKRIPPSEWFKEKTEKYSKFDEKGLPTHDTEGKEISKDLKKQLRELQIQQEKEYAIHMLNIIAIHNTSSIEDILMPFLEILSQFRHGVRLEARALKASNILQLCDNLRDEILPNVGVRLEDCEGDCATIELVDRRTLLIEREEKKRIEMEKAAEKERKLAQQAEKDALKRIPPSEWFKREIDKYSKFDEKGLPTHDAEGKEISKGLMKKLQKLQIQQEKRYSEYLQTIQQNGV